MRVKTAEIDSFIFICIKQNHDIEELLLLNPDDAVKYLQLTQ